MLTNRERLILLNLVPEIGSTRLRRLLEAFGDLDQLWAASVQAIQQVDGITPRLAQRIADGCRDTPLLGKELALAQRQGVAIVTLEDDEYPKLLRAIPDPPLALYVRGTLTGADEMAVGIVGARRASFYGTQCAERLGYDLALRGVTVVSGLAHGIDGAAHRGALRASGRTLAVLGSGLARIYPPEHEPLAVQVAQQGALLSEYPMDTVPLPHNFPRRNRLISGLSLGVVVVEAARRSGALITADCALEQGREVFAVPGPITTVTSQGTHQLLKQGARLVTSVDDILEELNLTAQSFDPSTRPPHAPQCFALQSKALGAKLRGLAQDVAPKGRHEEGAPGIPGGLHSPAPGLTECGVAQDVAQAQLRRGPPATQTTSTRAAAKMIQLAEPEQRVFACVSENQPRYIDAIAAQSGLAMPEVSSLLLQLELKRLIQQLPGKQFVRRS
jgi:DNA processing protein